MFLRVPTNIGLGSLISNGWVLGAALVVRGMRLLGGGQGACRPSAALAANRNRLAGVIMSLCLCVALWDHEIIGSRRVTARASLSPV